MLRMLGTGTPQFIPNDSGLGVLLAAAMRPAPASQEQAKMSQLWKSCGS